MKTKIIFTLLFLASLAFEASAFKVIISGGTSNHTYKEVVVADNYMSCKGRGHNGCPAGWNSDGYYRIGGFALPDITSYVLKQVEAGDTDGNFKYNGSLGVSWKMIDDENVEIDIDSDKLEKVESGK